MEDLIAIYKGLRMPVLGLVIIVLTLYTFWPSRKHAVEQPKYKMLDDELDPDLSNKILRKEAES